jgi:hypothetical protein
LKSSEVLVFQITKLPDYKIAKFVESTTALRTSEAAVGDWGENEKVGKEYREVAEGN